jgi:hypothetical protein
MKVNITLNTNEPRNGYINLNPLADPNDANFIRTNINELGVYLDDGEAEEIIALDVVDYVPLAEKENILRHWLSKLAIGGTITIGGNDLRQIAKALSFNQLDLNQTAELLYGSQLIRSGLITCDRMRKVLEGSGLKILESRLVNFSYYVKAERVQ